MATKSKSTGKKKKATKAAQSTDAIEMLREDHERVKGLFEEFSDLKESGSDEEKATLVAQICQELTVHTALEEEIFYPAVREAIDDEDLMDEALVEHAGAKDLIAQLGDASPDDDLYDAKVTVLGEQINHHVEEEEDDMFAKAEKANVDTAALGTEMAERKASLLSEARASTDAGDGEDGEDDEEDAVDDDEEDTQTPTKKRRR